MASIPRNSHCKWDLFILNIFVYISAHSEKKKLDALPRTSVSTLSIPIAI